MTEFAFNHPEAFPAGTDLGVYREDQVPDLQAAPIGAAVQTKTYEGASLTFTGLGTGNYLVGAKVAGVWR